MSEINGSPISETAKNLVETRETRSQDAESFRNIKPEEGTTVKSADSFWRQEFSNESETVKGSEKSIETHEVGVAKETGNNVENLQNKCIEKAEKTPDLNKLDTQAKGNYAEMKVDRDLAEKGYERVSKDCVTDLSTPTGPGIDGVYVNKETGKTLIVETKFNQSDLGNTLDGKQMSTSWIDNRLDSAVGKEMADKIRLDSIISPDSVQSVLARVDLNGDITYSRLDSSANIIGGIDL